MSEALFGAWILQAPNNIDSADETPRVLHIEMSWRREDRGGEGGGYLPHWRSCSYMRGSEGFSTITKNVFREEKVFLKFVTDLVTVMCVHISLYFITHGSTLHQVMVEILQYF